MLDMWGKNHVALGWTALRQMYISDWVWHAFPVQANRENDNANGGLQNASWILRVSQLKMNALSYMKWTFYFININVWKQRYIYILILIYLERHKYFFEYWLNDWLIDWLTDWLTDWLIDCNVWDWVEDAATTILPYGFSSWRSQDFLLYMMMGWRAYPDWTFCFKARTLAMWKGSLTCTSLPSEKKLCAVVVSVHHLLWIVRFFQ